MAAKPKWLLRIPEIIEDLHQLAAPVVDRSVIESLFRLRRRQAIDLMHEFGGYQAGRTFLINRLHLVSALEARQHGDDFAHEAARRERLNEGIAQLRRHYIGAAVQIPVGPSVFNARVKKLREDVRIAPSKLEIDYTNTEDLLTKLFELAQAAANDFERFQQLTGGNEAPV